MLLLLLAAGGPRLALAQEPPPPDSVVAPPLPGADTLPVADTLSAGDTLTAADTVAPVIPRNVPQGGPLLPGNREQGVWEWDRQALLSVPSLTLHDLLLTIPGVTLVRGGDWGTPVGLSVAGSGGGQLRVFLDGVEDPPQESGIVDLAQVGMTGLERVRVERGLAEIRIYLTTHQVDDPRPFTLLEVATGDLQTNLFRAGFVHPDAFGGTLLVALDRVDTEGPGRNEPGAVYGTRFRYSLFPRDGLGVALEYRSRTARRPEETYTPREVGRSELSARAGWEVSEDLTLELHALRSTVSLGDRSEPASDSLLPTEPRGSVGGRLTWNPSGPLGAWASASRHSGEGWPVYRVEAGLTGELQGVGGISARWDREGWSDLARAGRRSPSSPAEPPVPNPTTVSAGGWAVRGWTAPRGGVSLFAEAERGVRGLPFVVPPDRLVEPDTVPGEEPGGEQGEGGEPEEPPPPVFEPAPLDPVRIFQRDGFRAGARLQWRGLDLTGAWIRVEADSLPPFGLPFDRDGIVEPGGVRSGFEVEFRLPLTPIRRGLYVSGAGQLWNEVPTVELPGEDGSAADGRWRYLPQRSWTSQVGWYHQGYDGNLEIWADVGIQGRDAMTLPVSDGLGGVDGVLPGNVAFAQSWFGRLQFRVATVRVFLHWENLSFRPENADLPGRFLPQTRALYGVRWTMWN